MRWTPVFATFALAVACGSSDDEAPPPVVRGPIALGAPAAACAVGDDTVDLEKHACLHARSGPFASATAGAEDDAPSVSKTHTAYDVTMGASPSWVAYRPKGAKTYAFYTKPQVRIAVRGGSGSQLATSCEGPTTGACDLLPYATQVRLAANEDVHVALYPAEGITSAMLVIEDVD
ncbi:MAG: hypothetical protein KIT84_40915 [Labilithrix sp.]|nr:hypothetical protein [Labilithrix sp.]MCW5817432.1 hypothetical protein [Labilithrix sp.]